MRGMDINIENTDEWLLMKEEKWYEDEGLTLEQVEKYYPQPYKQCRDCDYEWATEAYWEKGNGRVAFSYPHPGIEQGDVVCAMCTYPHPGTP